MEVYEKLITVGENHLDDRNHVNNVVFLQWVQDVSKDHWLARVKPEMVNEYFWVVRSHHIDYKKQTFLGDQILVRTYVASYKGPFSERCVQFFRNDELLVESKSNWCFLRMEDQKPVRIPEEIQKIFGFN